MVTGTVITTVSSSLRLNVPVLSTQYSTGVKDYDVLYKYTCTIPVVYRPVLVLTRIYRYPYLSTYAYSTSTCTCTGTEYVGVPVRFRYVCVYTRLKCLYLYGTSTGTVLVPTYYLPISMPVATCISVFRSV